MVLFLLWSIFIHEMNTNKHTFFIFILFSRLFARINNVSIFPFSLLIFSPVLTLRLFPILKDNSRSTPAVFH